MLRPILPLDSDVTVVKSDGGIVLMTDGSDGMVVITTDGSGVYKWHLSRFTIC